MFTPYLPHTPAEREAMQVAIGSTIADIFSIIPAQLQDFELNLPPALSELELVQEFETLAAANVSAGQEISFIGAGAYRHYIPAALPVLAGRSEFLTSYTPYQAEVAQGTLQVIYEFQSSLCALTGMDIANASTYEGATSAAEAMTMASHITRRKNMLLDPSLHPEYREVMQTYANALDIPLFTGASENGKINLESLDSIENPAALFVQYPNFVGQIEDLQVLADWIHARGGLLVVIMNDPVALGLLEAPGKLGADIVTGEAQALGNAISYGGPYLGFLTARKEYIRQMPGRMCGLAEDMNGERAYTLVLQTREQHIRREKASSNICTNQGLNALIATIWLALIGKQGLQEMAQICYQRAHYSAQKLTEIPGVELVFPGPFFHEFVVKIPGELTPVLQFMESQKCLPGVPLQRWYPELDQHLLINVTEMHSVAQLERLTELLKEAVLR